MEVSEIMQWINSQGFPIAACVAMFVMYRRSTDRMEKVLDNNTAMMAAIKERLEVLKIGD